MSFIDTLKSTLKSLISKKTDNVVEEAKVNMEVPPTPVVETPVAEEAVVTPKVEEVIDQVTTDLGNISDTTTTESN